MDNTNQIISPFEKDQLVEVVNMGAAGAGTALAKMIGRPVTTKVPELFIDRAEKIPQFVGGLDRVVTAVLLKFVGDLPGMMLLVFSPETARRVAGLLTESHKKPLPVLDEIDRSALREAGNVLSGTFMNVLSKFLNLDLLQSVPDTATDRLGSVLDAVLVEMAQTSELALAVRVDFAITEEISSTKDDQLFFLFNGKASEAILAAVKKKFTV